jgi:F0F1-type ATP synthase delta subunit
MNDSKIIVTSSIEISTELKSHLEFKLKHKFGNHEIEYIVDESLIVGLTIRYDDTELSYDLNSQIQNITNQIM